MANDNKQENVITPEQSLNVAIGYEVSQLLNLKFGKDMLEMEGYFVIKTTSILEQMKCEDFINELSANPYQLKLIA